LFSTLPQDLLLLRLANSSTRQSLRVTSFGLPLAAVNFSKLLI
jgi:hypothetical protein